MSSPSPGQGVAGPNTSKKSLCPGCPFCRSTYIKNKQHNKQSLQFSIANTLINKLEYNVKNKTQVFGHIWFKMLFGQNLKGNILFCILLHFY
jgi:hypothetical protein